MPVLSHITDTVSKLRKGLQRGRGRRAIVESPLPSKTQGMAMQEGWMRPAAERGRPLIIAHRGLTSGAPENTVAAFRAAAEAGTDGVELDVRLSRDGEVVVLHDHGLERTTNGTGPAARRSLAEMKRLGIRGLPGERIPTLAEVFDALPASFLTIVELKLYGAGFWGLASRALRVVREAGRLETAMVASFSPFSLLAVRLIEPRALRGLIWSGNHPAPARGRWLSPLAAPHWLNPNETGFSEGLLRRAHARGQRVLAWDVSAGADLADLGEMGLDAVVTDHAEALVRQIGPG